MTNIFIQSPQGTAKAQGQPYALKQLVSTKIIGAAGANPQGLIGEVTASSDPTTRHFRTNRIALHAEPG